MPGALKLLTLYVMLFEKAVVTNVSVTRTRRLTRCLDIGVLPVGLAGLVGGATQLAHIPRQAS